MGSSYQPELWRDLFVTLGTSAAALIGLLFVAASVRINEAKNRPVFRLRVRNVTIHLVAIFVQAMAVLTPQPMSLLGAEVMAISLCGLWLPISFSTKSLRNIRPRRDSRVFRSTAQVTSPLVI